MGQKLKDLFTTTNRPYKVRKASTEDNTGRELESPEYLKEIQTRDDRFVANVNYATASNFARFGSAEKYYLDSIERVYKTYPYDGSLKEKTTWVNESTYLDLWMLENKYPRTTGYAVFAATGWSTRDGSATDGYGKPSTLEYISLYGGPHASSDSSKNFAKSFPSPYTGDANIWDEEINRKSNLGVSGSTGNTIEAWLKVGALDKDTTTDKQVIFDLWRSGSLSSSADYGRVTLELSASATVANNYNLILTAQSGTAGVFKQALYDSTLIATGSWNHIAVSFVNSGSNLKLYSYFNGELKKTFTAGTTIGEFSTGSIAYVGALVTAPSGNSFTDVNLRGAGRLSGSLDEFRFWTKRRTSKQIGRYWFTHVGGGTNSDNFKFTGSANPVDLGVYYKFNEGITGTSSSDSSVLDYSGRISNGTWTGYTSSSRNTGSAIVSASAAISEFRDPVMYSFHPDVKSLTTTMRQSGSAWDYQNNSSIYNSLPHWITEEDDGTLLNMVQIISSYFDTLHLQIQSLPTLTNIKYYKSDETPLPFVDRMLESRGLIVPEIFVQADLLERFASRDEEKLYKEKLFEIRNEIYQNIYNNLTYIYKTKGTEKSFRNLIRCYGIDDELIKINLYANNDTYVLKENTRVTTVKKHFVDFTNNHTGSVFQVTGSACSTCNVTNKAISLNGTNQYLEVADSDSLSFGTSAFSISFWINKEDWTLGGAPGSGYKNEPVLGKGLVEDLLYSSTTTTYAEWGFNVYHQHNGTNKLVWYIVDTGDNTAYLMNVSVAVPTSDEWVHVVGVYEGGTSPSSLKVYVNGSLTGTGAGSTSYVTMENESKPFRIGRDVNSNYGDFSVDEVAIWGIALDADEVTELYESPISLSSHSQASNLVSWWRMGDGANDTTSSIEDQIGSNDATVSNVSAFIDSFTVSTSEADADVRSYISGTPFSDVDPGVPMTFEAEVIFPYKFGQEAGTGEFYKSYAPLTSSLFGVHTAQASNTDTNYTWVTNAAATATIEFTGVPDPDYSYDNTIIIVSSDGTSRTYVTHGSQFGPANSNDLAFGVGTAASPNAPADIAAGLKQCIEIAAGHNGKITVTRDGAKLTLTQATAGSGGNTTIVTTLSNTAITSFTNGADDYDFQVYAVRDKRDSPHAYFQLTSSNGIIPNLTSSLFYNVYDNNEWNFAVRFKPVKYPIVDMIASSSANDAYKYNVEFVGVNANTDIVQNEFLVTGSMTSTALAKSFLTSKKRLYIGAHKTNFTGSILSYSDARISSARVWMNYLNDDVIKKHAKDSSNYGAPNAYKNSFSSLQTTLSGTEVPAIETIALNWDFATITGSDSSGEFIVKDVTSGSVANAARCNWVGGITNYRHPGRGYSFDANDTGCINAEYVYSAKQQLPEVINSSDMVQILEQDDEYFTREHNPITYYISFEKSMYQTISEEMLNMFASIMDFNNLIGEPVYRYRQSYKSLSKMKQFFFEKVNNTPDLDKFVDFYKWIDTSIFEILKQLTPVSANTSDALQNMVESHVLERNKYWTKFPTIETSPSEPEGSLFGINELLYNWKFGHAPIGQATATITFTGAPDPDYSYDHTITIISTDGTSRTYQAKGSQWSGSDLAFGVGHGGAPNTPAEIAAGLKLAIDGPAGHNTAGDKITVTRDGATLTLTQVVAGYEGNTAITHNFSNVTVSSKFSGGAKTQGDNCLWWKERVERDTSATSGDGNVDSDRNTLLERITSDVSGSWINDTLAHSGSGGGNSNTYLASTYALRRLSRPFRLDIDKTRTFGGGSNSETNKNRDFYHASLNTNFPRDAYDHLAVSRTSIDYNDSCDDNKTLVSKRKVSYKVQPRNPTAHDLSYLTSDDFIVPFTLYSSSVGNVDFKDNIVIANYHDDITPGTNDVPLQGPFTEKYVGGWQYRHVALNYNASDQESTRGEGFRIKQAASQDLYLLPAQRNASVAFKSEYPKASMLRDESAKRPVNIRNIKQTTGSAGTTIIGNYEKSYEVVKLSGGRSNNNVYFIESNGIPSPSVETVTKSTAPDKIDLNSGGVANEDAFEVLVPSSVGGSDNTIVVMFLTTMVAAGTNRINIKRGATAAIMQANVVAAINGSADDTIVRYGTGSGDSDNGIQGLTAIASSSERYVTLRVDKIGADGNQITFNNAAGNTAALINAVDFRDVEVSLPVWSGHVNGLVDFKLPDRGRSEHVIVNRFSAPGGPEINSRGALDFESEEYSAYNALPFRNLSVRQPLRSLLTTHAGQFGAPDTYDTVDFTCTSTTSGDYADKTIIIGDGLGKQVTFTFQTSNAKATATNYSINKNVSSVADFASNINTSIKLAITNEDLNLAIAHNSAGKVGTISTTTVDAVLSIAGSYAAASIITTSTGTRTAASDQPLITEASASYHKTNKNPLDRYEIVNSGSINEGDLTAVATRKSYDNYWVQREIPADTLQYTWITASYITSYSYGHPPGDGWYSSSADGFVQAIQFVSASDLGSHVVKYGSDQKGRTFGVQIGSDGNWNTLTEFVPTDFVGLNHHIYEPISSSANTLGYSQLTHAGAGSAIDVNYVNSDFCDVASGDTDDTAIRNAGYAAVVNSLLLHRNGPYQHPSWKQTRTGQHPIARYQKRNNIVSHTIVNKEGPTPWWQIKKGGDIAGLAANFLKTKETTTIHQFTEPPVTSKFKPIMHSLFIKDHGFTPPGTLDVLVPQALQVKTTYGNNLTTFANDKLNRITNTVTGDGGNQMYDKITYLYTARGMSWETNPIEKFDKFVYTETVYPKEINAYLGKVRGRTNYAETALQMATAVGGQNRTFWRNDASDRLKVGQGSPTIHTSSLGYELSASSYTYNFSTSTNAFASPATVYMPQSVWPLDCKGSPGGFPTKTKTYSSPLASTTVSDSTDSSKTGELSWYNGWTIADVDTFFIGNYPLRYARATQATASLQYDCFQLHTYKVSSTQYKFKSYIADWTANTDRATIRGTARNPWYDSYDDYAQDIRLIGQGYTTIPEFRVSEHMEEYLENNFEVPKTFKGDDDEAATFTLEGGHLSSSSETDFFKIFSHSDFLQHFDVMKTDHETSGYTTTHFKMICRGIKKFLPYQGFYPVTRTLQLGTLFSQSYGDQIRENVPSTGVNTEAGRMQTILQPLMAPGILYNSIKSGLAVDWPVMMDTGFRPKPTHPENNTFDKTGSDGKYRGLLGDNTTYINQNFKFRLPFEAIYDPKSYIPKAQMNLIDPVHVPLTVATGGLAGDDYRYDLAMHNFLAETVRFFLKDEQLSTFTSVRASDFKAVQSVDEDTPKDYYMDVILKTGSNFVSYEGPRDGPGSDHNADAYSPRRLLRGIHYGPACEVPMSTAENNNTTDGEYAADRIMHTADPAFAPYTPPYFYGTAKCRLKYTPSYEFYGHGGVKPDLSDIHNNTTVTCWNSNEKADRLNSSNSSTYDYNWSSSVARLFQMQLTSSIDFFGKSQVYNVDWNAEDGTPITAHGGANTSESMWVLSTKFECPVLSHNAHTDDSVTRGTWKTYGDIPKPNNSNGITLELAESFSEDTFDDSNTNVGSLLKLCGFDKSSTTRRIGEMASEKTVSEAIVAVPIFGQNSFVPLSHHPEHDQHIVDHILSAINDEQFTDRTSGNVPLPGPSIRNMVTKMQKYVIPPQFDFVSERLRLKDAGKSEKKTSVDPCVMYIFEFNHTFSKGDLQDIWQGIMPGGQTTVQKNKDSDKVMSEVSHPLTTNELMGYFSVNHTPGGEEILAGEMPDHLVDPDNRGLPSNLRWMVFKVKQKAETNYYSVTKDTTDDTKFKFTSANRGKDSVPTYSYNWPYDFFSLIELAKVDAQPTIKPTKRVEAMLRANNSARGAGGADDKNKVAIDAIRTALEDE